MEHVRMPDFEQEPFNHELFVEEIKSYCCVWDTSSRTFKETNKRTVAWLQISLKFVRGGKANIRTCC